MPGRPDVRPRRYLHFASLRSNDVVFLWIFGISRRRSTPRAQAHSRPSRSRGDASVPYAYLTSGGLHDGEGGRVTCLFNINQVRYAQYSYNGVAQVGDTDYWEPAVRWRQYSTRRCAPMRVAVP